MTSTAARNTADATVGEMIRRCARERPDAPALTYAGRTHTFADLDERSDRVACALLAAGVRQHDRVAFLDKNGVEFFDVIFGASKVNASVVPLNWRQSPTEIRGILADCRPTILFVGREFVDSMGFSEGGPDPFTAVVIGGEGPEPASDHWRTGAGAVPPDPGSSSADAYLQLYTSGTTGTPKGVVISNRTSQLFAELAEQVGYSPSTVLLMVLPLFHTSSSIALSALGAGGHCILHREVDLPAALAAIDEHKVTHAGFVPALLAALNALSAQTSGEYSSLKLIMYGASPISETVLRESMRVFRCDFAQLYGLTESGGTVAMLQPQDHDPDGRPELLRSLGKPLPWVEMRVCDPARNTPVEDEVVGELWVRSEQVMRGYFERELETSAVLVEDGWLRTGDLGYRDANGFFYLQDRLKDMIVSGAENVYPAEVENALMAHPGIADVAVIGVPDARWGETVKAIVLAHRSVAVTAEDVIAFARERIAHYKCPTSVDFTTEPLPRNASGKLLKRVIREPYWAGHDRRIT